MRILRLLFVLIFCIYNVDAIQRIVHGPTNTTVRVNQVALLRCQVGDQVSGFMAFYTLGFLFIGRDL